MITDFQILKQGKSIAEIYAIMCETPKDIIEKAKLFYKSYDECKTVLQEIQQYFITGIFLGHNKAAYQTSMLDYAPYEMVDKYDIIRLKRGTKCFRWCIALTAKIVDPDAAVRYSNSILVPEIYPFKDIHPYDIMVWDKNKQVNELDHKPSIGSHYIGPLDDTDGNVREEKEVDGLTKSLYGDWHLSTFNNYHVRVNPAYSSIWLNEKCIWGAKVLIDYLKSLNQDINTWDDTIIGEEYEVNLEMVQYVIDNFWDMAFYYDPCVKTPMRHVKKVVVMWKESYKDGKNELPDFQRLDCYIKSGRTKGYSDSIDLLPCMLKKKEPYHFSDNEKQILASLIEKKTIFISYEIRNGGGYAEYYDMTNKNTFLVKGHNKSDNYISLPWGSISVNEAERLLAGVQNEITHEFNIGNDVRSVYSLDPNKRIYSYDAERA